MHQIGGNKRQKPCKDSGFAGKDREGGPCQFKDSRVVNDLLKDSPSFKVVKKLCNRGFVSLQFMKNFKVKLGDIKAVINSKPEREADDEEYWSGKLIR